MDRTELELDGAVVAVLGASGGLGRALCDVLARRGARLLLAGRDAERLRDIGISGAEIVEVTSATHRVAFGSPRQLGRRSAGSTGS